MYEFHIVGYRGYEQSLSGYDWSDPVDITVFANTQEEAISKAEKILGWRISEAQRKIAIREILDTHGLQTRQLYDDAIRKLYKHTGDV